MLEFASSEEMSRRLQFGLKMSNAVFMFLSPPHQVTGAEENLFRQNLQLLISAWKAKPGQVQRIERFVPETTNSENWRRMEQGAVQLQGESKDSAGRAHSLRTLPRAS